MEQELTMEELIALINSQKGDFVIRVEFGEEAVSWMCVLGAAPFAAMGFITYHGMTAEKFIWAWIRSEFLEPKEIRFESSNFYYEALKDKIDTGGKA